MTTRKLALDVGWVFISQVVSLVAGIFLSVILGKFLGASHFGIYTMVYTLYTIASLVGGFGIPPAVVKYAAEYKEDKNKLDIFISCSIINSVMFGVITGILLFILSTHLANIFNMVELTVLIKIIAFSLPFLVINNTLLGLLNGLRDMKSYSFRTIIRSSLLLICTVLLVITGFGVKGAVVALLLSEVGTLLLLIFLLRNIFNFVICDYVITTKRLLRFGSQLFIANAIWMTNTNVDKLLIGYFLTDTDVGIYAIALSFAQGLLMIPRAISTITYPMISEYHSKVQHEAIGTLINKSMTYSFVVLSILGLLMIGLSRNIILALLDVSFLSAMLPLAILILGVILFGTVGSVGSAFSSINRPDIAWKISAVGFIICFILDILLIPIYGVNGAALGTTALLLTETTFSIGLFKKIFNIEVNNALIMMMTVSIIFVVLLITSTIILKNVSTYSLSISLFIISLYVSLLRYMKLITAKELRDMCSMINKIKLGKHDQ